MRKVFLTILTLTFINLSFSQTADFGVKAGLNYNFGGDLSEVIPETGNNFENIITGADNKAGFHVGFWTKFRFAGLYVRPELVYTQINNSYDSSSPNDLDTDLKTKKIDVPVLIGAKLIGPLHIYGGPALQYITKSDLRSDIENVNTNDFSVGLQLGTGLELGRLGVDVRWEKGFSNDLDGRFLGTNINVDNRPNQIIFGLSYRLNERND